MSSFNVRVLFPANEHPGEVVSRRFQKTITRAGAVVLDETEDFEVGTTSRQFVAEQNDVLALKLWNIDDAGNLSATASENTVTIVDDIPPVPPGVMLIEKDELPGT